MNTPRLRLGIDLGTSSVKVVVIDERGEVVSSGSSSYPTTSERPGQAEQEPEHWLEALALAVADMKSRAGDGWANGLVSIGLTGQLPTLVCLDGDGRPVGPAIAWCDGRADAWAAERLDPDLRLRLHRATGMPIDGRYLAPMFRFHRYDRRAEVSRILSAKDHLCFVLTGRLVTDPSTAAGYGTFALASGDWDVDLCAIWDLDPALLPAIGPADAVAGPLRAEAARRFGLPEGVPVSIGAADSVAAAFAMSGLEEDRAAIVMGSSSIVIAATPRLDLDPEARHLLTPHAVAGWYGREMDLLSTGTGYAWLCALLRLDGADFEAQALGASPGARGVAMAPYLAGGEQGALWNPRLSGVIHGLDLRHGAGDVARAFFEGVFFEMRRCLDVLEETAPIRTVVLSGHAAENPGLVALLADVLDRSVVCFAHPSPAAIGAALLGGAVQGGLHPSEGASHTAPEIRPGSDAALYHMLYRRHLDLFPRIADAPNQLVSQSMSRPD